VTPAGMERYEASARQIASAALAPERRERILDCSPGSDTEADDSCSGAFIEALGPLVMRRALSPGEVESYQLLARTSTQTLGDFYLGLEAVLAAWLMSPDFLFILERSEVQGAEGDSPEAAPLTPFTLASRLSYFFWNRGPDAALIKAASDGSLDTEEGYLAEVERLLADSDRVEAGVRALFVDLYELDGLAKAEKDPSAFPQFTSAAVEDATEQTLRTIVDHLLVRRADYRDLFTTRKTFMTRNLGPIYNVSVSQDWEEAEFVEPQRAGILTHVSFLALHARSSRSSPVLRGDFILEKILCRKIPPPPPDVNFDTVTPGDAAAPTARQRLAAHRVDPSCASCHDIIDPIGLALENFDAIGQYRTLEGGQTIETFGSVEGAGFDDIRGFHRALRDAPRVTQCMVRKLYMHGVGRPYVEDELKVIEALDRDFAADGHDFVALMKNIALSHGFRTTSGPRQVEEGQ